MSSNYDVGEAPGITQKTVIEEGSPSVETLAPIGILGVALKGSTDLTLVGSEQMSRKLFGKPFQNNSAVKGMEVCLRSNKRIWFKRMVSASAARAVTWKAGEKYNQGYEFTQEQTEAAGKFLTSEETGLMVDPEKFVAMTDEEKALFVVGETETEGVKSGTVAIKLVFTKPQAQDEVVEPALVVSEYSPLELGQDYVVIALAEYTGDTYEWLDSIGFEVALKWKSGRETMAWVAANHVVVEPVPYNDNPPKCVFTAKEVSEEMNGWVASVEVRDDKVYYELKEGEDSVEKYECDKDPSSDFYMGDIVNRFSKYIQVEIDPNQEWEDMTAVFAGGDSGLDITEDDVIEGIKYFADPEQVDIATFIIPGWYSAKVWNAAKAMVKARGDCMYIPSFPAGLTPKQAIDFVRQNGEYSRPGYQMMDCDQVAFYWPNGIVKNTKTGKNDVVDIAPYVAAAWSNSDNIAGIEFAPAGVKRGAIFGLDDLECRVAKADRDMLYHEKVNINTIIKDRQYGININGIRTSKVYDFTSQNTAMRYVNARRMVNYLYKVVIEETKSVQFDQNTRVMWNKWIMALNPHFRKMKDREGLYDYELIMDETTTTQEDRDNGEANGIIRLAIVKPTEYIRIAYTIARNGVTSFTVEEEVE